MLGPNEYMKLLLSNNLASLWMSLDNALERIPFLVEDHVRVRLWGDLWNNHFAMGPGQQNDKNTLV